MEIWQQELYGLLDAHPGAAERIARAFDDDRIRSTIFWRYDRCGCAYGHVYENFGDALYAAHRERNRQHPGYSAYSALERRLIDFPETVRAAVVQWLAEHGTASEPTPMRQEVAVQS